MKLGFGLSVNLGGVSFANGGSGPGFDIVGLGRVLLLYLRKWNPETCVGWLRRATENRLKTGSVSWWTNLLNGSNGSMREKRSCKKLSNTRICAADGSSNLKLISVAIPDEFPFTLLKTPRLPDMILQIKNGPQYQYMPFAQPHFPSYWGTA